MLVLSLDLSGGNYSKHSSIHSALDSSDVGTLCRVVVVSMNHERDGKENVVSYDLFRQGRRTKRCGSTMR